MKRNFKKILFALAIGLNVSFLLGSDSDIVDSLKLDVDLKSRFEASAFVTEGYTIEEHTKRVLKRYSQFSDQKPLPGGIKIDDFKLFLALHDIGKNQAKTEDLLFDREMNRKSLELFYSRKIFKAHAASRGMPLSTIETLSRLLAHDVIGDYLKGVFPKEITYQILLEDSSYTDISLEDFAKLHLIFHAIDAGSYPTLQHLFEKEGAWDYNHDLTEKLSDLFVYLYDIKSSKTLLDLSDEEIKEKLRKRKDCIEFFKKYLYGLIFRDQIKGVRSDESKNVLEKMLKRPDNFWKGPGTLYLLNQLRTPIEKGKVKVVHGSNSGVLVGLMKTATSLIPTGMLGQLGIVPLSGELREGTASNGVNQHSLSGSDLSGFKRSLNQYAEAFHVDSEKNISNLKTYIASDSNHELIRKTLKEIMNVTYYEVCYAELPCSLYGLLSLFANYAKYILYANQVKQLKVLSPADFDVIKNDLKTRIEEDISVIRLFYGTSYFKFHLPKAEGGDHHDYYYFNKYNVYLKALESCLEAIDMPISEASQRDKEILQNPFPIVFGSPYSWVRIACDFQTTSELSYTGPLSLGDGISHMIVPNDKVGMMQEWVRNHVKHEKPVTILSFEDFYKEYPESFIDSYL